MVTVLLKRAVPGAGYATSLSLITAIFSVGQAAGPSIAGLVVDARGLEIGTSLSAAILAAAALLAAAYGADQLRDASVGLPEHA